MPKLTSPLDHVRIAAPCPADWDQMFSFEDKRVRFCSQCNLNVYNLSDMSRQEAEALITKTEGRICVKFYRKSDGSILTQNCPVGLKVIKRRVVWVAQVVLGMVFSFVSGLGQYFIFIYSKPKQLPGSQFIWNPHFNEIIGKVAEPLTLVPIQVGEPKLGRIKIEHRQRSRVPQNKVKNRTGDQRIRQDE